MVDEFRRIYQSAGARCAFLASARNLYLESLFGPNGFYPRLSELTPPALFVWGSHDPLVPPAFARHVASWLPSAQQVTLERCGHVPQVERPDETNNLVTSFFEEIDPLGGRLARVGDRLRNCDPSAKRHDRLAELDPVPPSLTTPHMAVLTISTVDSWIG